MSRYRNIAKGCRKVEAFERTGNIDPELLARLAVVLEIDGKAQSHLVYEDYQEWFRAKNKPVSPYLLLTGVWGFPEPFMVPERLKTVAEMEAYAADVARRCGWGLFLCLSERVRMYFGRDGVLREIIEEVPKGEET